MQYTYSDTFVNPLVSEDLHVCEYDMCGFMQTDILNVILSLCLEQ